MIVKVQRSQIPRGGIMIYNEDRTVMYETWDPLEVKPVVKHMRGKQKVYFEASVVNTKIELEYHTHEQDW